MSVVMAAPAIGIQLPESMLPAATQNTAIVLEAPKTGFISVENYAEKAAKDADIDPIKFKKLISCESVWKEDAAGDNGTSFGILQFKDPTFELFNKKYKFERRDIMNPQHQIDLAVLMISDGYIYHWKNCGKKIGWIPTAK
ncbi:MAG: transglycosylase SLT domain-containing protein [Candidatus Sungbacteria bacterium]|nr:transglycosylase SLT domain-containing protein [Candidatus Sungbacteria bacterium]